jgi:hypothetical protein
MGEADDDVVRMCFSLRDLAVESIPVNFLNPIDGTPLAGKSDLNPRYCLKTLCLFRMANPKSEIRIAGGRELHLRSLQPLGLYAANSIFVGDYLTTEGQPPVEDYRMIEDLGFVVTKGEEVAYRGERTATMDAIAADTSDIRATIGIEYPIKKAVTSAPYATIAPVLPCPPCTTSATIVAAIPATSCATPTTIAAAISRDTKISARPTEVRPAAKPAQVSRQPRGAYARPPGRRHGICQSPLPDDQSQYHIDQHLVDRRF